MKARTLPAWAAALLLLPVALGVTPSASYATPPSFGYAFSVREADAAGTTHLSPAYEPPQLGTEYTSNPPTYGSNDAYAQDEVIIQFLPNVSQTDQNALMQAHGMSFGRRIYGTKAFVAKVPVHTAMTVTNALRNNSMLDVVGVNPLMEFASGDYTPNDPLVPQQEHLGTSTLQQINARRAWNFGQGLNQVSLIAIVDVEVDRTHEDIVDKYRPENWQQFYPSQISVPDAGGHGTHVAGLAAAGTDNNIGIAGTGFSAWPMSLALLAESDPPTGYTIFDGAVSAVNWAADHGASVINMSFACRTDPGSYCRPDNSVMILLKTAVDRAHDRGITIVAAAGNYFYDIPAFPASFGQAFTADLPPYDQTLVIAVSGTKSEHRHPDSNYGNWIDFGAPYGQDDGQGILSTVPTTINSSGYERFFGTSMAAPQVAGLASLLTSLGYQSDEVYDFIKEGATDLVCDPQADTCPPGFDKYTGWGRINMGLSMELASRSTPGMAIVPDEGYEGIQWFNFQASGFPRFSEVQLCLTPPFGEEECFGIGQADRYGVIGIGLQFHSEYWQEPQFGEWKASMIGEGGAMAPGQNFVVLEPPIE